MGKDRSRRDVPSRTSARRLSVPLTPSQRQALDEEQRQARRWQGAEARKIFDQVRAGTMGEVSWEEIDAVFADPDEGTGTRSKVR